MKKFLSLAALGLAAGAFTLASCGEGTTTTQKPAETTTQKPTETTSTTTAPVEDNTEARKVLATLIFDKDGQVITGDLKLTKELVHDGVVIPIKWTSDSELVAIGEPAEDKDTIAATVSRPSDEATIVTLTAEIEVDGVKASKEFTVKINPYAVSDVIAAFKFTQANATVDSDFDVPTTYEFNGETATISWEITLGDYLAVSTEGNKILVTPQESRKRARVKATFTYKGETVSTTYNLTVFRPRTPEELLTAYYEEVGGDTLTLKGYVAHTAGYDPSYGNGYLYVVDQTLKGGYYIYRAYASEEVWNQLTPGTPVAVAGAKSTSYNGLIEVSGSNGAPEVSIATDMEALSPEDLAKVTDGFVVDELLVAAGLKINDSVKYYTGAKVNLKSWKVASINSDATAANGGTVVTLQKDDVTLDVVISKYTTALGGDVANAVIAERDALKVGDFVDAVGILSFSNSKYCVYVSDADTFKAATDDNNATLNELADVLAPISVIKNAIPATCTEDFLYDASGLVIPDGVTLTVTADSEIAKFEDNQLTIKPTTDAVTLHITITASNEKYEVSKVVEVYSKLMTVEDKVNAELDAVTLNIEGYGDYELAVNGTTYTDVAISYEVTSDLATYDATAHTLSVLSVDDDTEVVVTVKASLNDVEKTRTITLTIKNQPGYISDNVAVTAPEEDKVYFLGLNQEKLGQVLYANGTIASNRLNTTTAPAKAMTVTVEKMDAAYAIKFVKTGKYLGFTGGKLDLVDKPFAWTYDAEHTAWTGVEGGKTYFIGTYSNYETISASEDKYIANDGQWKGALYLATGLTKTKEEKLEYEFEKTAAAIASEVKSGATVVLPTSGTVFSDVKATYAKKTEADKATVDGGNITFGMVGTTTRIWFTVTLTCGDKELVEEFYFDVQPVEFKNVTECLTDVNVNDEIFIKGIVTEIYNESGKDPYAIITDGTTEFEVFGTVKEGSTLDYGDLTVGQVITASGKYALFGNIKETAKGTAVIYSCEDSATNEEKANAIKTELAIADKFENEAGTQLATNSTTFPTATITWIVKSGSGVEIDQTTYKMSVTLGDTISDVTVTATITYEGVVVTKDITFTVYDTKTVKAFANVTGNTDPTKVSNLTTSLGLDDTVFTVTYNKGNASGEAALRTDGVRMYATKGGVGQSFTFTANEGYKIDWVIINFDSGYSSCAVVKAGDTVLTAANGVYTVDGAAFTLIDDNSSVTSNTQVRFQNITIHYSVVE